MYGVATSQEPGAVAATPTETSPPLEITVSNLEAKKQGHSESLTIKNSSEAMLSIAASPSWLPGFPPAYTSLLDYFMHVVGSFCCDETVKTDFYTTFLPMGIDTSHVLASMLNLAAVHRLKAGLTQDVKQLAMLQAVAVEQLRSKLSSPPTETTMATILMLCFSSVVSGGETPYSWRMHLEGAVSLLSHDPSSWTIHSQNSTRAFLARCFVSLMALASMSGRPPTDSVSKNGLQMLGKKNEAGYIDEFTAFSVDLTYVLFEIGALVREKDLVSKGVSLYTNAILNGRSLGLIEQLQNAVDTGYAKLKYGKIDALSSGRKRQYLNINEAYHQAAILQLYQRILGLASSADEMQRIVCRILTLIADVDLHQGPCPGVVLLFPLFSAGSGAVESTHRQQVRDMLRSMVEMYGISNVQHSMRLLEALWAHRDEYGESETNISWEAFVGMLSKPSLHRVVVANDRVIDKDIDIILY